MTEQKKPVDALTLAQDMKNARRVSTPLVAIQTTDPASTMNVLAAVLKDAPIVAWDAVRGVRAVGAKGCAGEAAREAMIKAAGAPEAMLNLTTMLEAAAYLPESAALYVLNAQMFLTEPTVRQAIWNLRDQFKVNGRTLILMGPSLVMPIEIAGDVIAFDEPLPTRDVIEAIVRQQVENAEIKMPSDDVIGRACDASTGLTAFSCEQNTAMAIKKTGIDIPFMQERRCQVINSTAGLSVWRGDETFDSIGGNSNIKTFMQRLIDGRDRFGSVVWIDEIEKQIAGAGGDTSGVAQDQHMQLLTYMQNRRVPALLLVGHPGTGKSEIAKAAGNAAGCLTLQFDLGGMKDQYVGGSQAKIRQALKVVDAVSAGKPLFIATSNDLKSLSPELRSRFRLGTFFFDLPTQEERDAIWKIHSKKIGLTEKYADLDERGWTGREIATCCDLAWRLNTTVRDASQYVVPVATSQKARVEALREEAEGRFISASYAGTYQRQGAAELPTAATGQRKITPGD